MSTPPAGYVLIQAAEDSVTARRLLAAAALAGADPSTIKVTVDGGGYYVPTAVATAYATLAGVDPSNYLPADPADLRAWISAMYVAKASAAPSRRRISASPSAMYAANSSGFVLSATNTTLQSRLWQRTPKAGRNVTLELLTVNAPAELGLGGDGSNITVRAAVEYPAGTFYPAYGREGNRDVVVSPNGGIARLVVPGFEVPANQDWWVRVRVFAASTGALQYTLRPNLPTEWAVGPNSATTDLTITNTGAPAPGSGLPSYAAAPTLVSYEPYDQTTPCVVVIGDSITQGHGDDANAIAYFTSNPGGWAIRALSADGTTGRSLPGISNLNLACESEKAHAWVNGGTGKSRFQLIDDVDARTAWVLFTNDIANPVATLQADFIALWTALANRGLRVVAFTIPPRSTSTDNWATTANQTSSNTVIRPAANQWLRAGAPIDPTTKAAVAVGTAGALVAGAAGHPVSQIVDLCPAVETAPDSGIWKVTGTAFGYTVDGTHPSSAGHAAMAAVAYAQAVPTVA